MKYQDILPDVLNGKWIRHRISEDVSYFRMKQDGQFETEKMESVILERSVYTLDTWEIKPEEIYVWGWTRPASNTEYESFLLPGDEHPNKSEPVASTICRVPLFPLGKARKYKLTLVDEEPILRSGYKDGVLTLHISEEEIELLAEQLR